MSPVLSSRLLSLCPATHTAAHGAALEYTEAGTARGRGQLLHFPPTKSQKWQKVKAHQHVKTLVIIKTLFFFFFCQISSWVKG